MRAYILHGAVRCGRRPKYRSLRCGAGPRIGWWCGAVRVRASSLRGGAVAGQTFRPAQGSSVQYEMNIWTFLSRDTCSAGALPHQWCLSGWNGSPRVMSRSALLWGSARRQGEFPFRHQQINMWMNNAIILYAYSTDPITPEMNAWTFFIWGHM